MLPRIRFEFADRLRGCPELFSRSRLTAPASLDFFLILTIDPHPVSHKLTRENGLDRLIASTRQRKKSILQARQSNHCMMDEQKSGEGNCKRARSVRLHSLLIFAELSGRLPVAALLSRARLRGSWPGQRLVVLRLLRVSPVCARGSGRGSLVLPLLLLLGGRSSGSGAAVRSGRPAAGGTDTSKAKGNDREAQSQSNAHAHSLARTWQQCGVRHGGLKQLRVVLSIVRLVGSGIAERGRNAAQRSKESSEAKLGLAVWD